MILLWIRLWLRGGSLFCDARHSRREALREWKAFTGGYEYRYRTPAQVRADNYYYYA